MMLITDGVSTTGGDDPTAEALSMAALAKDEGIFIIPGMTRISRFAGHTKY